MILHHPILFILRIVKSDLVVATPRREYRPSLMDCKEGRSIPIMLFIHYILLSNTVSKGETHTSLPNVMDFRFGRSYNSIHKINFLPRIYNEP